MNLPNIACDIVPCRMVKARTHKCSCRLIAFVWQKCYSSPSIRLLLSHTPWCCPAQMIHFDILFCAVLMMVMCQLYALAAMDGRMACRCAYFSHFVSFGHTMNIAKVSGQLGQYEIVGIIISHSSTDVPLKQHFHICASVCVLGCVCLMW